MSEWKIDLWKECEQYGGAGRIPDKIIRRGEVEEEVEHGHTCPMCHGQREIRERFTLAQLKKLMKEE